MDKNETLKFTENAWHSWKICDFGCDFGYTPYSLVSILKTTESLQLTLTLLKLIKRSFGCNPLMRSTRYLTPIPSPNGEGSLSAENRV